MWPDNQALPFFPMLEERTIQDLSTFVKAVVHKRRHRKARLMKHKQTRRK